MASQSSSSPGARERGKGGTEHGAEEHVSIQIDDRLRQIDPLKMVDKQLIQMFYLCKFHLRKQEHE